MNVKLKIKEININKYFIDVLIAKKIYVHL